ncbi:MAG TPA: hypothetical protein VF228_04455 [Iamia sp.]
MTLEVSALFLGLAELEWQGAEALATAAGLADAIGGAADHDDGAGEDWARVLLAREQVGMVHMRRPIALVEPDLPLPARGHELLLIVSLPLGVPNMRATPEAIDQAFGHGGHSPAVLDVVFSPMDLWFATV